MVKKHHKFMVWMTNGIYPCVLQGVTTWSAAQRRHTLPIAGRAIRYSHDSELAQRLMGIRLAN